MSENNVVFRNEDFFLQETVKLVNKFELSFSITLNVSGLIITGNLISGKIYYEGQAEIFENISNDTDGIAKSLSIHWKNYTGIYDADDNDETEGNVSPSLPGYIHLKDAQIISGTTIIPQTPMKFWRGKIASVDGFTIGRFSPDTN